MHGTEEMVAALKRPHPPVWAQTVIGCSQGLALDRPFVELSILHDDNNLFFPLKYSDVFDRVSFNNDEVCQFSRLNRAEPAAQP